MCLLEGGRRALREVIDYSKDFLSGETIERKRNKDDVNYRGIATIQVFDEKGNIVQEVKSENCINKRWLSYLYRSFFGSKLTKNKNTNLSPTSPAAFIALTDNIEGEDNHGLFTKGNLIGWADGWKTYSGANKLRGTVNESESTENYWKRHFVIDFPTHAANGTFQSIYWLSRCERNDGYIPSQYQIKHLEKLGNKTTTDYIGSDYIKKINKYGDFLYFCSGSTIYKTDVHWKIYKEVKTISSYVLNVCILNDKIWAFNSKNNSVEIYDLELNYVESLSYDITGYNITSSVIVVDNMFLHAGGKGKTFMFDDALHLVRTIEGVEYYSPFYLGNGIVVFNSSDKYYRRQQCYDLVNNKILNWVVDGDCHVSSTCDFDKYEHSSGGYDYFHNGHIDIEKNEIYFMDYSANLFKACFIPWFAHTLLPAPVTKTATNTMKIQYDFVVEERGYFD